MVQYRHLIGRGLTGLPASHDEGYPAGSCRARGAGVLNAHDGVAGGAAVAHTGGGAEDRAGVNQGVGAIDLAGREDGDRG